MSKCVIVVNINYRLGTFGFPALPHVWKFGLQDITVTLKWLRIHIHDFGGDPDKIIFCDESGGTHAAGLLMTSPLTEGLF
jgi:carboxylesterase type B